VKIIVNFILVLTIFTQKTLANDMEKNSFKIFSGDKKASYYAVAKGICNVFSNRYFNQGFECVPFESKGSEANLKLLATGEGDLAIIKSLELNQFFIKNAQDLQDKTISVARIHDEYLTILVQKNLQIKSLSDLENKIVNIGSIGSTSALITQKYFTDFSIVAKEIVNFGAAKSFEMMCDKKIDAWVYFMGHANNGFKEVLQKCDLELISLTQTEIDNFLKIAPFLQKAQLAKNSYKNLQTDLATVSSPTFLASRKNLNPKIIELIKDILANHKEELIKESEIFKSF
jgi:uncharacterized protein